MSAQPSLCFPPFRLEFGNEQLWRGETVIPLRRKTFAVLRQLVEHHGHLVTKEQLFNAVWPGVYVGEVAVTICITELRKALSDNAKTQRVIETVHGRGYRFIASLTTAPRSSRESRVGRQGSEGHGEVSPVQTRDARRQTLDIPLVGREPELTQLHQWLDTALSGERQMVFVTGEPGIGKTTLLEVFLDSLKSCVQRPASEDQRLLRSSSQTLDPRPQTLDTRPWLAWGQCIQQHGAGEAFLPILDALGQLGRGPHGGELIALLRRHAPMWLLQLPSFIDPDEHEALQRQVQGASRERMLREMAETLERWTAVQSVLLVLEDLHWSDVLTLDLLAFLARRKEPARLLVIGTYRPVEMLSDGHPLKDLTQELYGHGLGAELSLGVLSEEAITRYLEGRFRGGTQQAAPLQKLACMLRQRTDGNPLFLVSTVDDLVVRGQVSCTDETWTLPEELEEVGIADSIRQLVARQRRRLSPEERHTLEAASVAGVEFSAAAVAAALATGTGAVEQHCDQLADRHQFLQRRGVEAWPDGTLAARYGFLHALYQQLWHERVSPTQLQHYHLRIGERKEQAYGVRAREIAAELAVHFEQGRGYRQAVRYLQQAGESALRRSALKETIALLTKELEILKILPDTPERTQQELTLLKTLGPALISMKGYGAPEVEQTYARAYDLCQQDSRSPPPIGVLHGLQAFYLVRGEIRKARDLAAQALRLAQHVATPTALMAAHGALGSSLHHLGEFTAAREHLEQALVLYTPQEHIPRVVRSWVNPGVLYLSCVATTLWYLGYPDQALKKGFCQNPAQLVSGSSRA